MSAGWPNVGTSIRRAREAAGVTQRQLAAALGVGAPAVSRIETSGNLNIVMLRKIGRALGVPHVDIVRYAKGLDALDQEMRPSPKPQTGQRPGDIAQVASERGRKEPLPDTT